MLSNHLGTVIEGQIWDIYSMKTIKYKRTERLSVSKTNYRLNKTIKYNPRCSITRFLRKVLAAYGDMKVDT